MKSEVVEARNRRSDSLVVIGGSSGGLRPIQEIVANLPRDFSAPLLIVIHYPKDVPSALAEILGRAGPLPVDLLTDGAELVPGRIGVAPPGRHLEVLDGHVALRSGPRENGSRPSIDVLFRSAVAAYRSRTIGVIVSGMLDDGTVGLVEIARRGGYTVVQDPDEAAYPSMPLSALRYVRDADVLKANEIAGRLVTALQRPPAEREIPREHPAIQTRLSCPDCGGPLAETSQEPPAFRCRVGHAFTIGSLEEAMRHAGETALWQAIRTHEERRDVLQRLASAALARQDFEAAKMYERFRAEALAQAQSLRSVLHGDVQGT